MKILMVCLGNICRSPIAEAIFKRLATERGLDWTIRSAGTNEYHKGGPADARMIRECSKRGVDLSSHIARRVTARDFEDYDLLFSMAQDVTEDLREMCPRSDLMRKVVPFLDVGDVPDPWYGSAAAFSECYDVVERASRDQLARLVRDSAASERL